MQITRIVVDNVEPKELGVCGEFSIYLDNEICIHKMRVINGEKGLFVAFPSTGAVESENGRRFIDVVHPTKNSLREEIQAKVLERYEKEIMEK